MMERWYYVVGAMISVVAVVHGVSIPPTMTRQGPKDIFFKPGETVKIECEATGIPTPTYHWKRAEVDFAPEGNDDRFVKQKGSGTLIINSPEDKDEGFYQCFATNSYGTAATIKFNVKEAKLDEFSSKDDIVHRPSLGSPLRLNCQSPDSVPDADIYWAVAEGYNLVPILWDARVTMDYEDRLYFTYVAAADAKNGAPYHCVAYNSIMRMSVVGPPQYIQPQGAYEIMMPMAKAWPTSRFDLKGLVGTDLKMKCIFSGNPTPVVRWKKKDNVRFSNRVQLGNSFGQELVIRNLQFEDAGAYLCDGTRDQELRPLEMSVNVNVNSRPTWVSKPKDISVSEGGTAEFQCSGEAVPKPQIFWFINGEKLENAMKNDPRLDSNRFHHLKAGQILLQDVTKNDAMVIQCNITNQHGYIWGEAFLNVLAEAPTILERPENVKVAEGQPFRIQCHIIGKPDPIITWHKNDRQVTGGRYILLESGSLYVETAVLSDAGEYKCNASNIYGTEEATGKLIVRRKTVIEWKPMDLEVQRKINAKFTCSGTTDPEEIDNMKTTWLKDYKPVELGERMFLNAQDNSLTISGSEQEDTGTYTCVVSNGLDNDTASARLVVTDIPDVPYKVIINDNCTSWGNAYVQWTAGSFNNAPIQYFTVEYMTTTDPNHWVFAAQINQTKGSAFIPLMPGMDYKFRVTAYNKIGASDPSLPSNTSCRTTTSFPAQHPRNVRTIGDKPGQVHIEWTPVPPEFQGGGNFSYVVVMHKIGDPDTSVETKYIPDWRVSEYLFPNTGNPYQAYEITVKSRNNEGDCKTPPRFVIGHSDEAIPSIWPSNLEILEIKSDAVVLQWSFDRSEIGKIDTKIRGEFRGFKVQFWEENMIIETIRELDIPPEDFPMNTTSDLFNATIHHLLPNTRMEARVALLNNFFVSRPTEPVSFTTPPGVPGPVEYMEDMNIGDNHINLRWNMPLDNRGDLIGYDIGYQKVEGLRLHEMQERMPQIDDPYATTAMLSGLMPETKYRIYIWARTEAGRGEEFFIERTTASPGEPVIPRFTIANVGHDFINVTWWRDAYRNSGSIVYVEYKRENGAEWFSTTPDVTRDWVKISMLESGINYNIRIVVINGESRRISEEEDVMTDGVAPAYDLTENLGWFLAMIFSIMVHMGLVTGFIICYRKGFRFKSQQKEVRTYRDGDETYTDKAAIPRYSEDFGAEPGGFSNDYYKDGYEMNDDEGKVEDRGWRDNYGDGRDYNGQDHDGRDYDGRDYDGHNYDDYHDHDYPHHDQYGEEGAQPQYGSSDDQKPRLSSHEYEDYDLDRVDAPGGYPDKAYNTGVNSSREKLPPPKRDLNSSRDSRESRNRYSDDHSRDRTRKPTQQPDYRRDDYYNDRRTPYDDDRRRHDEERRQHQNDRQPRNDRDYGERIHRSRHQQQPPEDHYPDHDHQHHRNHPDHDHERCRDVVEEFKRYSGGEAAMEEASQSGGAGGYSGTVV